LADHTSANWKIWRDDYNQNSSDINAVMEAMVLYADSLSKLAAAGETGKESVQKINRSVTEIVELVGRSNPISSGVLTALEAFADAWTNVQAQDALADAMKATDPQVEELAKHVAESTEDQKAIVEAVRLLERRLVRQAAGPNRMSWYTKNNGYRQVEDAFSDGGDIERAAALTYLIESLEPRFRIRHKRRVESTQWRKARIQALDAIAMAAADWRQSHLGAADVLAQCGGLSSLRFSCGNYTAANLKLAADRIRAIVAASAPADAAVSE